MRFLARLLIGPLLGVGAACSLTSLDGYSSGELSPPGPSEAGTTTEAGMADAGVDGSVAFCASRSVTFCSDFDDAAPLTKWTAVEESGGGKVGVDSTKSVSPSSSLLATVSANSGSSAACLRKVLGPTNGAQTFRVELDLLVEDRGSANNFDVVNFKRSDVRNFGFEIGPNGRLYFDEDIPPDGSVDEIQTPTTGSPALGEWTRVAIVVVLQGSVATVRLSLDGVEVGSSNASDQVFRDALELQLGDCSMSSFPSNSWRVRIDNVVVDVK